MVPGMSRVEQIEGQVKDLSPEELKDFRSWFAEFDAAVWDQQIEADAENGKLLSVAERALRDHQSGRSSRSVNHQAAPDFWIRYRALPADIRALADRAFALLKTEPRHPSLHFKKVGASGPLGLGYIIAFWVLRSMTGFFGFWIGSHAEYDWLVG